MKFFGSDKNIRMLYLVRPGSKVRDGPRGKRENEARGKDRTRSRDPCARVVDYIENNNNNNNNNNTVIRRTAPVCNELQ